VIELADRRGSLSMRMRAWALQTGGIVDISDAGLAGLPRGRAS